MRRYQFYIAAGLYLVVTMLKLTIPAFAAKLKETILPAMQKEVDYVEVVSDLGARLTENEVVATVMRQFSDLEGEPEKEAEQTEAQEKATQEEAPEAQELSAVFFAQPGELDPVELAERAEKLAAESAQNAAEEAAAPAAEEPPAVVTAFLASQEAYASLGLPDKVSYAMPDLPFAYVSPVGGVTSSGFGYRTHPLENEVKFHYGTDFAANLGSAVYAFAGGTVYAVGEQPDGYGRYIMLDHGNGWMTLYAHCNEILVLEKLTVEIGQQIATVGQTGAATGAHLHFELLSDGTYLNPEFYLTTL